VTHLLAPLGANQHNMKRFFDFSIALILFIVFMPLITVIGVLVRIKLGSPVLFRQTRPGLNGIPFLMYKVKPGITGWAQINGRNSISWPEKFKLDVWYVDNQSFMLDVKILILTIVQVYKREGVHQEGHVTAEEFMGDTDHER